MKKLTYFMAVVLMSVACWGEQITLGAVAKNVMPLMGADGQVLQWNAETFAGGLFPGSYYGSPCGAFLRCYGFNGTQWQFNMTGDMWCRNTCTYNATGPITLSITKLPDGSTTTHVSATLRGTFVDEKGVEHDNVLGYFNSFTNPAKDGVTELAGGGLVLVLRDN
jgi:hypothetical protein